MKESQQFPLMGGYAHPGGIAWCNLLQDLWDLGYGTGEGVSQMFLDGFHQDEQKALVIEFAVFDLAAAH